MTLIAYELLHSMEEASDEEGRQASMESINASPEPLATILDIQTGYDVFSNVEWMISSL